MRNLMRSFSSALSACLPHGKSVLGTLLILGAIAALPVSGRAQTKAATAASPVQNVIVIFGENRSFDHVFGTYIPKAGQTVWNLYSQGIVDANGTAGKHYSKAHQFYASDLTTYEINPTGKTLWTTLPPPLAGGDTSCGDTYGEPFCTLSIAETYEPNLDPDYFQYLITGATGITKKNFDTRITNDQNLAPGPFQITNGTTMLYDDYAASPIHRFYHMWQQTDCTWSSSKGAVCKNDLFPWVEVSAGDSNGAAPPAGFTWTGEGSVTTGEGATSMGFYNVAQGDAPYLNSLAQQYTLLDNLHQSVMGGTGANHIVLGYGDAMFYSNPNGSPGTPPSNQIENPNPQPGTNNYYTQDGYSGGSYTNCAELSAPGVKPILTYLHKAGISSNCDDGNYYLLNNYNPGYYVLQAGTPPTATGYAAPLGSTDYTIPPSSQPHIGDVLSAAGLSYTFFGEDWNIYAGVGGGDGAGDPYESNPMDAYCNICNPFQYASDIMTSPSQIAAHIGDMTGPGGFYTQLASSSTTCALPNVSIIQPSGFADGHPATSKIDIWEGFVKDVIETVQASPCWNSAAIILIFDEGGGYYDSGYIQPVDFFGDGTRMPSLIVSPYTTGGNVYHGYADHVSIDKFIERNWNLPTISFRSRDNLPNPAYATGNAYVPTNGPAIDDLWCAFSFATGCLAQEQ